MSIEAYSEVDLDATELSQIAAIFPETQEPLIPLIQLNSSVENIEKIQAALLQARALNKSALLLLRKPDFPLEDEEILGVFRFLRDWDQMALVNVLALCGDWIPHVFQPALQTESKIELKWFREWLSAASDSRIHKYPGLPWRSFIRKIVTENFAFATKFMELVSLPANEENVATVQNHLNAFLEAKKKVVCVFPKRWEKQ